MIRAEKENLRSIYKKQRSSLSQDEVAKYSQEITENFLQNLLPKIYSDSQQIFSLYLPANNEVDTSYLSDFFVKNSIAFSYPKIIEKNSALEFLLFEKEQKFVNSKIYKTVTEPEKGLATSPDFIILPLLAFDKNMSRLGMGGGFFDRTISKLKLQKNNILVIALAYDFQGFEAYLPTENTDQKLDFIVTPSCVISQKPVVA